jgi:hypothetical protein
MKRLPLGVMLVASGAAQAGIPLVNATCPGNIEVHADKGGPIYINGKEGKLEEVQRQLFRSQGQRCDDLAVDQPGRLCELSHTGKNRANGICQVKGDGS